jgi:hypothetical protein
MNMSNPVADLDRQALDANPDPAKIYGSDQIRILNVERIRKKLYGSDQIRMNNRYMITVFQIGQNVYYLYDLAMSPVVGICEQWLGQVGEEVLEYGGALVHRELVIVQVQRDSLKRLTMLGDGWSS